MHHPTRRKTLTTLASTLVLGTIGGLYAGRAGAAEFPERPIRVIIPFPPGGIYYSLMKSVTDRVSLDLGQPFVIEHKPGAGTTIGTEILTRAAPDGYTIGVLGHVQAVNTAYYPKFSSDLEKELVVIAGVAEMPTMVIARADAPFGSVAELTRYGKENPGKLLFGAATSYAMDLLADVGGFSYTYVPYKGHPEALSDLTGGRIDLSAGPANVMLEMVKAGRLRAVAVLGPRRMTALTDMPAINESLPDFPEAGIWISLAVPRGLPEAVQAKLSSGFKTALADPAVIKSIEAQGFDSAFVGATPDRVQQRLRQDAERAKVLAKNTQKEPTLTGATRDEGVGVEHRGAQ